MDFQGFAPGYSMKKHGPPPWGMNRVGRRASVMASAPGSGRAQVDVDANVERHPFAGGPDALADAEAGPYQAEMALGDGLVTGDFDRERQDGVLADAAD